MKQSVRQCGYSRYAALLFGFLPSLALAHTGAGETGGWLHGLAHPFSGLDHLCAMIAVGMWAAQLGGRAVVRVPLTFLSVMALGGLLGAAGVSMPLVEQGILISLLVLGGLVAAAVRLPVMASAFLVGVFALFHGYAHGAEMPPDVSSLGYAIGFMLATAALHALGVGAAFLFGRNGRARWLRYAGAAIAICGGGLWLA